MSNPSPKSTGELDLILIGDIHRDQLLLTRTYGKLSFSRYGLLGQQHPSVLGRTIGASTLSQSKAKLLSTLGISLLRSNLADGENGNKSQSRYESI